MTHDKSVVANERKKLRLSIKAQAKRTQMCERLTHEALSFSYNYSPGLKAVTWTHVLIFTCLFLCRTCKKVHMYSCSDPSDKTNKDILL